MYARGGVFYIPAEAVRRLDGFDSGRGFCSDVVGDADDTRDVIGNAASQFFESFKGQSSGHCEASVETVPAADFNLLSEITFAVAHSGDMVGVKNGHILKGARVCEGLFDDGSGLSDSFDAFGSNLADYSRGKSGAGEGDAVEDLVGQAERLADLSYAILAKLNERFDDVVAEDLFGVDAELLEYVVLAFDAGDGFIDVGEDSSLKQIFGAAVFDDSAEDVFVEGLRDCFTFLLGVGDAGKGSEEFLLSIDYFDFDAKFSEQVDDALGFALSHQAVLDENGFEALAEGTMAEHRYGG